MGTVHNRGTRTNSFSSSGRGLRKGSRGCTVGISEYEERCSVVAVAASVAASVAVSVVMVVVVAKVESLCSFSSDDKTLSRRERGGTGEEELSADGFGKLGEFVRPVGTVGRDGVSSEEEGDDWLGCTVGECSPSLDGDSDVSFMAVDEDSE